MAESTVRRAQAISTLVRAPPQRRLRTYPPVSPVSIPWLSAIMALPSLWPEGSEARDHHVAKRKEARSRRDGMA